MFLGPPYNSMPFADTIDYRSAAVVFNVTNTSGWLPEPMRWTVGDEGHATYPNDAQWWVPDVDVSDVSITVRLHGRPICRCLRRHV